MHRTVAAALVAALALGVASCGGSEETLSRAQLARRIEQACRQGQNVAAARSEARRRSGGSGQSQFIATILAGQRVAVERIEDLNPASDVKDDYEAFKQAMRDRIALFVRVQGSGETGTTRAVQAQGEAVTRRLHDAAGRLGVEGCV
jgi:hypothetical protein